MTKKFDTRTVLSVTTGRLLTRTRGSDDNGIGDLYDLLGWMTGEAPFTHQLPRFGRECKPHLERWFPDLARVDLVELDRLIDERGESGVENWLAGLAGLPRTLDVPKIPRDDHEFVDPVAELRTMAPHAEILVVDAGDKP